MRLLSFICLLCLTINLQGQGIEFFKGTWEEALEVAEKEDKLIFVDAYASWCGPCKRMSKDVFPEKSVGKFYNANFISLKLDMEKDKEGIKFRKKYPVAAFPTLFYVDYNGEVVMKVKGAQNVERFINTGKAALAKIDRSAEYATAYEAGDRDPKLVYNYIKALNKAGKSSQKVANDYLIGQKDLTTPENLKIILEAAVMADSRIFKLLIENRAAIAAVTSAEEVSERIQEACANTVDRAIEFKSIELLEEAKAKMAANEPALAEQFALESDMTYYYSSGNIKKYISACKKYAKLDLIASDSEILHELAISIVRKFRNDAKAMKLAEELAASAAFNATNYEYYLTYAMILGENSKKQEGLKIANTAMDLAKEIGPNAIRKVEMTIQQLEG